MSALVNLISASFNPQSICGVCLTSPAQNGVTHLGANGHLLCRSCAETWAIQQPKKFTCPVCKIDLNPLSILTQPEYMASLVQKELIERGEQREVASEDEAIAEGLLAEIYGEGEIDRIVNDAAIARALQAQDNRLSTCVGIYIGVGTVAIGYLAMRYFF